MSHTPLYQAHTPPATRAWTHRLLFFLVIVLAVLSLSAAGLGRGFATPVMVTDAAVEAGSSGTDGSRPDLRTTLRETFVGEPDVPQAAATATPAVTPPNGATAEVRAITGTAESAATTPPTSPTAISPRRAADNGTDQPGPAPAASRQNGILFSAYQFSAYQANAGTAKIVTLRPDGTGRQQLGTLPGRSWAPKISPDGKHLLFSSAPPTTAGRAIDININGTGSPDMWIADIDGSRARRLTDAPAGYNGWSWSPDGRWIAFASNQGGSWDIYKMMASGAELTRLTISPSQDGWPVWTPDGTGIVFVSTRTDRAQLYRMDASGGNVEWLLTSNTADTEPTVASGSGRIAFSAQTPDGNAEIYVVDRIGFPPRQLTAVSGLNTAPVWSPDGTHLAFTSRRDGRDDIYVINDDGSGLVRLTSTGENGRPDWGQ